MMYLNNIPNFLNYIFRESRHGQCIIHEPFTIHNTTTTVTVDDDDLSDQLNSPTTRRSWVT